MAYCQECGTEVSESAEFCPECRADLRTGPSSGSRVAEKSAVETIGWAWETLVANPGVVVVFAVIGVLWATAQFVFGFNAMTVETGVPVWFWPTIVVYAVLNTAAIGMTHYVAEERIRGGNSSLESKLGRGAKRIPALVGIALLTFVPILVGFLLFIIPGIYLALRFELAMPACFIDRKGPVSSVKASWNASSGNVGKLFVLGLILGVVSLVVSGVAGVLGFVVPLVGNLWSAAFAAVLSPLGTLTLSYVYLENRDASAD